MTKKSELFEIGNKVLVSLVTNGDPMDWYKFKLKAKYFKGSEVDVFNTISNHIQKYSKLPEFDTLASYHPQIKPLVTPEPSQYYRDLLISRHKYTVIKDSMTQSQSIIGESPLEVDKACDLLQETVRELNDTKYNDRILNFREDAPAMLRQEYYNREDKKEHKFYWDYMDEMANGFHAGDVISFVGRPARGKTFMLIRTALMNWRMLGARPLIVSMEMTPLSLAQRMSAMYAGVNLTQLRSHSFATPSEKKFRGGLEQISIEGEDLFIVDGNLAATAEEVYLLASNLNCDSIYIDGAYMLKHTNPRLDRFTRVAENVELMKQYGSQLSIPTVATWQLNREAAKKSQKGTKGSPAQKSGLEDIGYSDAIGQISSVVLALMEPESVETLHRRVLSLLKGRNGEVGEFAINWDFMRMNFDQCSLNAAQLQHL